MGLFPTSASDIAKIIQAAHSPTAPGGTTQQVTSYSLGPISAGSDSFLGGLLAAISGTSQNYAAGAAAVGASPVGQAINLGGTNAAEISSGVAAANAAYAKSHPNASPIDFLTNAASNVGKLGGYVLGGIGQVGGAALGSEAGAAAPGIAAGVGSTTTGVLNLGTQAVGQGILGSIQGIATGIGAQAPNLPGGTTGGMSNVLLIGGGLLLLFLLVMLLK